MLHNTWKHFVREHCRVIKRYCGYTILLYASALFFSERKLIHSMLIRINEFIKYWCVRSHLYDQHLFHLLLDQWNGETVACEKIRKTNTSIFILFWVLFNSLYNFIVLYLARFCNICSWFGGVRKTTFLLIVTVLSFKTQVYWVMCSQIFYTAHCSLRSVNKCCSSVNII